MTKRLHPEIKKMNAQARHERLLTGEVRRCNVVARQAMAENRILKERQEALERNLGRMSASPSPSSGASISQTALEKALDILPATTQDTPASDYKPKSQSAPAPRREESTKQTQPEPQGEKWDPNYNTRPNRIPDGAYSLTATPRYTRQLTSAGPDRARGF
jgi:hypothetical protein